MSVLNQSGEEQVECPLCMEPLEVDDLNFYPCTCGYQICRFCWHRIRTDENGLCPACRKAYSENPADFTPLSKEQVAQLKAEKRQRDQQRKAKLSESRKHLAAVRVVQKNLVFVVGLPVRLADADILKRHEYFGKFGKIHKVVINQSTSYAGSQGPSASAYVTYIKSDDALRAIQSVNNITLDGRVIKSSLGTTKYCSHFMKNQACPKADCMYLHDFGDPEASFTKEQMHIGKHQEYEKKLHESLQNRLQQQQQSVQNHIVTTIITPTTTVDRTANINKIGGGNKDSNWPTLNSNGDTNTGFGNKTEKQSKTESKSERSQKKNNQKNKNTNNNNNTNSTNNNNIESTKQKCEKTTTNSSKNCEQSNCQSEQQQSQEEQKAKTPTEEPPSMIHSATSLSSSIQEKLSKHKENHSLDPTAECLENLTKLQLLDDNSSFFSHNTFHKILPDPDSSSYSTESSSATPHSNILNDNLPDITSSEDWQAAFGFSNLKSESPILPSSRITENGFTDNLHQRTENGFGTEPFNVLNNLENFQKQRESIIDTLAGRNVPNDRANPYVNMNHAIKPSDNNLINGLDQNMSKFFADYHTLSQKNGYNHLSTNGYVQNDRQNILNLSETQRQNMLLHYQDHPMFNIKQSLFQNQQQFIPNHTNSQYMHNNSEHFVSQNGQKFVGSQFIPNPLINNQIQQQQRNQMHYRGRESSDDDLGFDPFHETQKALAELIESEQDLSQIRNSGLIKQSPTLGSNISATGTGLGTTPTPNVMNGLGLLTNNSNSNCVPPPPPGFMQHNTHMNSFGSKILPFLNVTRNQQQMSNSGGWSTNYNEAQVKGLAPVNDWMTLDPAIVSSSRHFPINNIHVRDQYPQTSYPNQPQSQCLFDFSQSNTHINGYTNPPPTIQSFANNYAHLSQNHNHTQSNGVNWFNMNGDVHGIVNSPPGFRQTASAQSKTQEC